MKPWEKNYTVDEEDWQKVDDINAEIEDLKKWAPKQAKQLDELRNKPWNKGYSVEESQVAELPDGTRQDKQPEQDIGVGKYLENLARGFSARGNQAINALNPLATAEDDARIAAEQQWVKQNKGAGAGETLADIAITAPAGGISGVIPRVLATGYTEGLTHNGSFKDKAEDFALGSLGAGIGEGAAKAIGFIAKPFKKPINSAVDKVTDALRSKAQNLGIPLHAGQQTGNKFLNQVDSQLSVLPPSSGIQSDMKEAQRLAWQKAVFNQGGEDASMATRETMGAMKDRISGIYDDIASRNDLLVDAKFKADLASVENDLMGRIPTNQKGIVKSYLKDFGTAPEGAFISGKQYQDIRSMLDKQARNFKNTDSATEAALKRIRKATDDAMERSLIGANGNAFPGSKGAEDLAAWRKNNKDYAVMKAIEKAIDTETETIKPHLLLNNLARRDPNRVIYGKGDQELTDIAKVGKAFIQDKAKDSGTAINSMIVQALTGGGVGSAVAGTDYAFNHDPERALGLGALSLGASILGPKAAAKAMWKDGGYLSKGLVDLSKETIQGLTRQKIISELLRNYGNQISQQ